MERPIRTTPPPPVKAFPENFSPPLLRSPAPPLDASHLPCFPTSALLPIDTPPPVPPNKRMTPERLEKEPSMKSPRWRMAGTLAVLAVGVALGRSFPWGRAQDAALPDIKKEIAQPARTIAQ